MRRVGPGAPSAGILAQRADWRAAWLRRRAIIHVDGLDTHSGLALSRELAVAYLDPRRATKSWLVLPEKHWDGWLEFDARHGSGEPSLYSGARGFDPKLVAFALASALHGVTPYAYHPAPLMKWLDRLLTMAKLEWRLHVLDAEGLLRSQRASSELLQQATAEVSQRYPASNRAARDAAYWATLIRILGDVRNRQ